MRRATLAALLSTVVTVLVLLAPAPSGAVERVVPVRTEQVRLTVTRERTVRLQERAQHVALHWRGHHEARVSIAFSRDGERFSLPVDAGRDPVGELRGDGTTYGALLDAGDAGSVRVRSDRPIARLTVLAMHDGTARTSAAAPSSAAAVATTMQPPVRSRAQWGADESLRSGTPTFARVRKLIVHHTASPNSYATRAEAESQIRAILTYHAKTQGWSDIGYNFLVDKFGNVYEGRWSRDYGGAVPTGDNLAGDGVVGAHTGGWNSGSLGVAVLGTHSDRDISGAARSSLEQLLAWAASRNGIDPTATEQVTNPSSGQRTTTPNIAGHRAYGPTECPGEEFNATLPALRSAVAGHMTAEGADTAPPSRPTGLAAAPRRHRVALTWEPSTDDSGLAPRYRVLRARTTDGRFRRIATTGQPEYVDTGLRRKRLYFYKVRAVDAAGNLSLASTTARTRTR